MGFHQVSDIHVYSLNLRHKSAWLNSSSTRPPRRARCARRTVGEPSGPGELGEPGELS